MLKGDCDTCINGKLPSYSATCVECGLSRKNYKPITNADRIRAMSDEELAKELLDYFAAFYDVEWTVDMLLDWLKEEASE